MEVDDEAQVVRLFGRLEGNQRPRPATKARERRTRSQEAGEANSLLMTIMSIFQNAELAVHGL